MSDEFPNPNNTYLNYGSPIHAHILRKLEAEIAKHLRNQRYIDDMKRRFGVSNREDK